MVWMNRAAVAAALAAFLAIGAGAQTAEETGGCAGASGTPCPRQASDLHGKPAGAPASTRLAVRARMKQCGAEWKADRAAGKVADGTTWPKYLHACNARLKAAG